MGHNQTGSKIRAPVSERPYRLRYASELAAGSEPRHQRGVDHVRHALAADRLDGEVDVLEPELVGRHQLQREALGRQLLQSELAGLVAVAARAFHRNELHRELLEREVRERGELALRHDDAALALERLDPK